MPSSISCRVLTLLALAPGLFFPLPAPAQEDTWRPVAPMPTARESVAACALGGYIHAIGGFPGGSDAGLKTNERYDPGSNSWTARAQMPTGRRMPVTGVVDGKCYVIGGRVTDGPRALDVVEEYDPATDSWRTRSPMPTARFGHSAAVIDGIIYVVGGVEAGVIYPALEAYDPATDSWTARAPMPAPRALAGAAAFEGRMYVIGGTLDGDLIIFPRVDIYDPATDSWSRGADMPFGKFSLSVSTANGRIYAIGGADGPGAINAVAAYDPRTDSWSEVSPMLTRRARFATAAVDNRVYAIGGTTSFGEPHVGMDLVEEYTPEAPAEGLSINAGFSDAWYNPATNGQGFLISVFPDLGQMFVAWFTFDAQRPPDDVTALLGEPGHRWLTAQGPYSGDTANLTISLTAGGIFDAADPPATTDPNPYGTMTIEFADCSEGLVEYEISSPPLSGTIPIERVVPDRAALCEALSR